IFVLHAGKFGYIGAGDEAREFRRADHKALRLILFNGVEHPAKLGHDRFRKRIRARTFAVDDQPADALTVLGISPMLETGRRAGIGAELQLAILQYAADFAFHAHTISISMAPPCPPPMHSVAMPRFLPRRFIAFTRCNT